ncbi:hypothetical protein QFC21_005789 [Naganishia friedmannii]|uniref:Uncharacterized protein n=1 Tax=Naganishia friedmannii TaxID=89922 RepID=A0ACC2V801_9TREE|nr:hypothetical protein QFC21_005789 [Naganishia friedmannii]
MPVTLGNWPRFQYFNQLEGKQERRNRTVQSCTECRRRKSKCDRKFPCGPCTLRKEEHLCVEHQRVQSEGLTGYTHLQDFDLLTTRVKELELMLLTLINDNSNVLNLSRVQPYLEGVDGDGDGDNDIDEQLQDITQMDNGLSTEVDDSAKLPTAIQSETAALPRVLIDDQTSQLNPNNERQEKGSSTERSVRFEDTSDPMIGFSSRSDGWMTNNGQGGMRSADITHRSSNAEAGPSTRYEAETGYTTLGTERSQQQNRPANAPTEAEPAGRPLASLAQQLIEKKSFGNNSHDWNSNTDSDPAYGRSRDASRYRSSSSSRQSHFADGLRRHRSNSMQNSEDDSRPSMSRAPSLTEHHAALALEDMALNRNVARDGATSMGSVRSSWQGISTLPVNTSGPAMMPGTQPSWARRVKVAGLEALPPIGQAQPIITYFSKKFIYLVCIIKIDLCFMSSSRLEWLFRIFHIPTFFQRLAVFNTQLPLVNPVTNDQAAFTALYAAIICTSLHLMDEQTLANVGVTVSARPGYLQDLSDLVEQALVKCDWAGVPRIETLQAFIIIGPYWSSSGRIEAHLGLLGTAVKIAHNLGINRLGPELKRQATYQEVSSHFGPRWVMASDREVGRRIWWTLVELDWNASPDHQFNHVTPKNLSTCAEPAHVNDESLIGHGPVVPEPLDVHTRFVESAIDNGRLRYEIAVDTQADFFHTIEDLSPFYRLNADFAMDLEQYATDARQLARMAAEKRVINTSGHLRILRCHRFYLPEAYHIAKYNYSKEAVLRSSKWLLNNNPTRDPIPGVPLRFWPISYSLLVATIISMLHLCHVESLEVADAAVLVRCGIEALRVDQGSPALTASADAIQQLYDIEMAERQRKRHQQPPPMGNSWGKRKREEDEQELNKFQRLVKKAFGPPSGPEQSQSNTVPHFNHQMNPAPPIHGNGVYNTPSRPTLYDTMQQPIQEDLAPFHGFGTNIAGEQPLTSLIGDPNAFLADESLLELMKWGASSFGPDAFGSGLWPFPGDTPSSHGGQRGF